MPAPADNELYDSLFAIKEMHPEIYSRFVQALYAKTDEVTVAVTEAPSTDLHVAQGRAQNARGFLRMCIDVMKHNGPR